MKDKKIKKPLSKTPRETFSLDEESQRVIDMEIAEARQQGFEIKRSAVIRAALRLLKTHRETIRRSKK